jgi:hypothetical protein
LEKEARSDRPSFVGEVTETPVAHRYGKIIRARRLPRMDGDQIIKVASVGACPSALDATPASPPHRSRIPIVRVILRMTNYSPEFLSASGRFETPTMELDQSKNRRPLALRSKACNSGLACNRAQAVPAPADQGMHKFRLSRMKSAADAIPMLRLGQL